MTSRSVSPTWTTIATEDAPISEQTVAAFTARGRTYVVSKSAGYDAQGAPIQSGRLSVFEEEATWSVALASVDLASFAEEADGTIDLAIVGPSRAAGLRLLRIGQDKSIDQDSACTPANFGTLAFGIAPSGEPVAWVRQNDGLSRLVYTRGARTWTRDRGPFTTRTQGRGIITANEAVAFAWDEDVGGWLDAKATGWAATLDDAGDANASFNEVRLGGPFNDYVETQVIATANGISAAYCNLDDTGFFLDDHSASGEHCYLWGASQRDWPASMGVGHKFGVVAGVVAAAELAGHAAVTYRSSAQAEPEIVMSGVNLASVDIASGNSNHPVLVVRSGDGKSVSVLRERTPAERLFAPGRIATK